MSQTVNLPKAIASHMLDGDGEAAREFVKSVHDEPGKWKAGAIEIIKRNFLSHELFIASFVMKTGTTVYIGDMATFAADVLDELLRLCYPAEEAQTPG